VESLLIEPIRGQKVSLKEVAGADVMHEAWSDWDLGVLGGSSLQLEKSPTAAPQQMPGEVGFVQALHQQ